MSTKSTILLTDDNEHWYFDCASVPDDIVLEFNRGSVSISNDEDSFTITIKADSDLYKHALRSLMKGAWFNNSWK